MVPQLADIMKNVLLRLDIALDEPPFNFIIHTSPRNQPDLEFYHWHIEIMPKLTRWPGSNGEAGFTSTRRHPRTRPKHYEVDLSKVKVKIKESVEE